MVYSPTWTPRTPFELQREVEPGVWQVAGFYSEKPVEADDEGYRCAKRDEPAKKKGGA